MIVIENPDLGALWARHLERQGAVVTVVADEDAAMTALRDTDGTDDVDVIVADLDLTGSGAIGVADYAAYRQPGAQVVFVTASSFFSDGSIFSISPNACALLSSRTLPDDLAHVVAHHAERARKG